MENKADEMLLFFDVKIDKSTNNFSAYAQNINLYWSILAPELILIF